MTALQLVIKLSNVKSNYNMLIEIAKVIGGTVRITGKETYLFNRNNKYNKQLTIIKSSSNSNYPSYFKE
ncbi:uncharacterized protein RAG0_17774 [Rhynchosporium agropyri]|uniref:Homing endonuclease LAGLIDADG domain-containing protein n=1 Tax=Rhynchosporium agropyri TaxID=914238 RepID=A0A1E1LU58_9HELO|nr:uncharacterized protein RAG0_17774 [Rhynchosporium agropyri]